MQGNWTLNTTQDSKAGFDPADGENKLAYEMLKKTVADISYKYDSEAELPNSVTVLI